MKELIAKYRKLLMEAQAITALCETEKRDFTADERQKVANLLEAAAEVKGQIAQARSDAALTKEVLELSALFEASEGEKGIPPAGSAAIGGGTLGERFVKNEAYQAWWKAVAPGGALPSASRGIASPPVAYKAMLAELMRRKALITGSDDASAGAFVETDYTRIYEGLGRYDLNLLDLISRRQTGSDLVHFVRQTAQVTQATPVAEANVTDYDGGTGEVSGEKPEGTSTWEPITEAVKTIAVWIPATKRALADVAQLRGLIDQELRDDLQEELEDQVINGDGVGENFTGIVSTAGVLLQAWNTDILTTSRQAITNLLTNGRSRPSAWAINPEDWETVELIQDSDGRYYFAGPQQQGPAVLWGVPVVQSQTVDQGVAILGDWRKSVIWDREQATISISDSHEDFFIRNMVAILAELRAAFGVIRPSAFVLVDMESGS